MSLFETGITALQDTQGTYQKIELVLFVHRRLVQDADFDANLSRVKLLATISASGESCFLLWIFNGCCIPFRIMQAKNGQRKVESGTHILPPDLVPTTHNEEGRMNTRIFHEWCSLFLFKVIDLSKDESKVFSLFDDLRAHL